MTATGKDDIRQWFIKGVAKGAKYMLIVYDRMGCPDNSDAPYYADSISRAHGILREFSHDPMCKVMEVYDLTADREAQLAEKRAWNLPGSGSRKTDGPMSASGMLSSGKTRLDFMEAKNRAYMKKYFGGTTHADVYDSAVFTDNSRESVNAISVYLLVAKAPPPAKTSAAVYIFGSDGGVKAHYIELYCFYDGESAIRLDQAHILADRPYEETETVFVTFERWYTVEKKDHAEGGRKLLAVENYSLKPGARRFGSYSSELCFIDD